MATPTTLPAAFVAGAILTADQQNNLRGAFRVLQVLTTGTLSTLSAFNSTTYADATGFSLSITPSSATSKVLVIVQSNYFNSGGNAGNGMYVQLLRGASSVYVPHALLGYSGLAQAQAGGWDCMYLDSPATTSATTYKIQAKNAVNANNVQINGNGAASTMFLLEISA
jgi:hypothetical protein